MLQLEKELVQARLSEAESHCALKEMQDKVLEMEKVNQIQALLCKMLQEIEYKSL